MTKVFNLYMLIIALLDLGIEDVQLYPHYNNLKETINSKGFSMKEEWKDILGYEGYYQISNIGRVKSLTRKKLANNRYCNIQEKILKKNVNNYGYILVRLYKNGKSQTLRVHRLVAQAFISNPKNKPQVNHIDGNKQNNSMKNLEWCTNKENTKHAFENKLCVGLKGEKHPIAKLTKKDIFFVRKMVKEKKYKQTELAEIYKVNRSTIWRIINNKSWRHI